MSRSEAGPPWFVRLARVGAAALAGIAIVVWVTPVNVRSQSGFFGCGSPADPRGGGDLVDLVCKTDLDAARLTAVTVLIAAAVVLFLSEFVVPRFAARTWLVGVIVISPLALGLVAISVARLLTTVGGVNPTGSPFRCGTPLQPATDAISNLVCGQLAQTRLSVGVGGLLLGIGLLAGGAYVAHRRTTPDAATTPMPDAAAQPASPEVQQDVTTTKPAGESA